MWASRGWQGHWGPPGTARGLGWGLRAQDAGSTLRGPRGPSRPSGGPLGPPGSGQGLAAEWKPRGVAAGPARWAGPSGGSSTHASAPGQLSHGCRSAGKPTGEAYVEVRGCARCKCTAWAPGAPRLQLLSPQAQPVLERLQAPALWSPQFSSAEDAAQALKKKNHEHIGSRYVE